MVELELILSGLKSYGERKPLDFEVQFLKRFSDRTVIEDLVYGTTQNNSRIGKSDNTIMHSSHQKVKACEIILGMYRV